MIGFSAILSKNKVFEKPDNRKETETIVTNEMTDRFLFVRQSTLNKFINDKSFVNDSYMFVFEGIILNKDHLKIKSGDLGLYNWIINLYETDKLCEGLKKIRGSFCGLLYDKKRNKLICFTDPLGTKPLFYSSTGKAFIVSTEVKAIVELFRKNKIAYHLDLAGAYSMLTYGYMYDDLTIISEIKKLTAGTFVSVNEDKYSIKKYYSFVFGGLNIDFRDAVEQIDIRFLNAVSLQLKKNKEYGFVNLAPLSAGLDCRMTSYAINRLLNESIINYTYSETGQLDQSVPAKMAAELGNRWIFKSLNNGLDLINIDRAVDLSDSLIQYGWPAQLDDFMRLIDSSNLGIIHTGVIGDVIVGTWHTTNDFQKEYQLGDGAFSKKLIPKLKQCLKKEKVYDYETGLFINRAFNGACMGYSTTYRMYTEAMSPFMDLDFMEFCLSLPIEYRFRHNIYYEWVLSKYPNAAKHERNGLRIASGPEITVRGRSYKVKALPSHFRNKLRAKTISNFGMNPIQYWYLNNQKLKESMDSYFEKNIVHLNSFKELQEDASELYKNGVGHEKLLPLSLIGSMNLLFKD